VDEIGGEQKEKFDAEKGAAPRRKMSPPHRVIFPWRIKAVLGK